MKLGVEREAAVAADRLAQLGDLRRVGQQLGLRLRHCNALSLPHV